jgi:hypothetical protein
MPNLTKQQREKLWGDALGVALKFALYLTHDKSRAEVLAADALAAALDPKRSPWNSEGDRTLSQHVVKLVKQLLKDQSAKKRVREDPVKARTVDELARRAVPRPDARIRAQEQQTRGEERERKVREGLDAFCNRVFDLFGEELTPAEQALKLGVNVRKIYEARRRIAERIRALSAEDAEEGSEGTDADMRDGDEQDRDEDESPENEVSP